MELAKQHLGGENYYEEEQIRDSITNLENMQRWSQQNQDRVSGQFEFQNGKSLFGFISQK